MLYLSFTYADWLKGKSKPDTILVSIKETRFSHVYVPKTNPMTMLTLGNMMTMIRESYKSKSMILPTLYGYSML